MFPRYAFVPHLFALGLLGVVLYSQPPLPGNTATTLPPAASPNNLSNKLPSHQLTNTPTNAETNAGKNAETNLATNMQASPSLHFSPANTSTHTASNTASPNAQLNTPTQAASSHAELIPAAPTPDRHRLSAATPANGINRHYLAKGWLNDTLPYTKSALYTDP